MEDSKRVAVEFLKDCRVASIAELSREDGLKSWRVEYVRNQDGCFTVLDEQDREIRASSTMVNATVSQSGSELRMYVDWVGE